MPYVPVSHTAFKVIIVGSNLVGGEKTLIFVNWPKFVNTVLFCTDVALLTCFLTYCVSYEAAEKVFSQYQIRKIRCLLDMLEF